MGILLVMVKTVLIVGITNNYPVYNPDKMQDNKALADAINHWVGRVPEISTKQVQQ